MANLTFLGECEFESQPTDPLSICIATMYILFGIVYTLFGYRCFKAVMFLTGFIFASVLVYLICIQDRVLPSYVNAGYRCFKAVMFLTGFIFASVLVYLICIQDRVLPSYVNAGIAICAGLMFGLITMLIQYVGLFMTGFHTGLLLALATFGILDFFDQQVGLFTAIASLLGSGLFFAIINLQWQRGLTVLGTCVYGGALVGCSVDYLIESFRSVKWLWQRGGMTPCYPVVITWPMLVLIGIFIQCGITAPPNHNPCKHPVRPRTREQRAELRQNKYRYLYQVRTAHGDVISQNYVQAIQNKVIAPGETSTLESDATHLTMLPDGQTDFNRSYYR